VSGTVARDVFEAIHEAHARVVARSDPDEPPPFARTLEVVLRFGLAELLRTETP
jgi:hypothetical protein